MSLLWLVVIGTIVVTLLGTALFVWLAWLLSHQPAPLRSGTGWADWLKYADGSKLFDAARTTATILAIVGIGGAALVAYRRQDTAERAHKVAIEGQRIANAQHELDSQKYQLDRDRHQLDTDRRRDDREKELRARFASTAEQLGSSNFAVRYAGAYALASLADDWHHFGNDDERQVCVNVLCAQLRRPRPQTPQDGPQFERNQVADELEVRRTIVALIKLHRPRALTDAPDWRECTLDFASADLSGLIFRAMDLQGAIFEDANLTRCDFTHAYLGGALLRRADLTAANFTSADLTGAMLSGCRTEYSDADNLWGMRVTFDRANMTKVRLTRANLPSGDFEEADLTNAVLNGTKLESADFTGATFRPDKLYGAALDGANFTRADLRGTNFQQASPFEATFTDARYNARTQWQHGIPDRVLFDDSDADEA
ncbi:pentapeptide repeat-containing protein [Mycolicibacterium sphagni]|nr:pentapeptide repeat-containing protein [Mycolicibacterium sphagni]